MSTAAPVCPRCASTRFFHVTRVVERGVEKGDEPAHWKPRAVGVMRARDAVGTFMHPGAPSTSLTLRGAHVDPVGHFETIICRRCGHATWLAREWAALPSPTRMAACRRCATTTTHAQREAVESGGGGYEPVRLTRGRLGREGFVDLDLCTACGLTAWLARDYLHVTDRAGVHRFVDDAARPCLECGDSRALVVEAAREYDGERVPVALHRDKVLRFFAIDHTEGRYVLHVCTGCHAIEWTAQRLDEIEIDPAQGVFALGDEPATFDLGPYR